MVSFPNSSYLTVLAPYDLTRGGSNYAYFGHTDVKELALYIEEIRSRRATGSSISGCGATFITVSRRHNRPSPAWGLDTISSPQAPC